MTATKFNITQVHRITGKSPTTIRKHIKNGNLSCERDANGNPIVVGAELSRAHRVGVEDFKRANPSRESPAAEQGGDHQPSQLTSSVQARLGTELDERKQERERYERRIEDLHDVLKRTQEGHERAMRLIEDRSQSTNDWEKPLKALQAKVANQE
ncbi:hypothetical protein [Aeoliella sp.]|uniref:hypothetical protein n=1 Tax=Aeoliella sp. TaxID=2795800 RepID=UPI003CCB7479